MSYPDWVYDRDLQDEDWVHDRWGDDDDYDDDDYDDFAEEPNKKVKTEETKKMQIFNKTRDFYSYEKEDCYDIFSKCFSLYEKSSTFEKEIKSICNRTDLLACYPKNNCYYVVLRPEIKKLTDAFGLGVPETTKTDNIMEATKIIEKYTRIIQQDLFERIIQWEKASINLKNGNIDFIDLYSDKQSLNEMVSGIIVYYGCANKDEIREIDVFSSFRNICRKLAFQLDAEERDNKLRQMIHEKQEKNKKYQNSYDIKQIIKQIERNINWLSRINQKIDHANCYSRETFAMLYIRLEPYVIQERAMREFFQHNFFQSVSIEI